MSESNEEVTEFTKRFPPPANTEELLNRDKEVPLTPEQKTQVKQSTLDDATISAQQRVVLGLSQVMTEYQVENMKNLAPQDKFTIGDVEYTRKKITPKALRTLREAEAKYVEELTKLEDPTLRQDREWQLLQFKANLYFGMSPEQFEETDIEKLQTVIQATELRTQGFRQYKQ